MGKQKNEFFEPMRTYLTSACLIAAAQAVSIQYGNCGATCGTNCPDPCNPDFDDFSADTDHVMVNKIDIAKDTMRDVQPLVDGFVELALVEDVFVPLVGEEEAYFITHDIVEPIIDAEVCEKMVDVETVLEKYEELNPD